MAASLLETLRDQLTQARMALLGYAYNYDRTENEAIVSETLRLHGKNIEATEPQQRRFARTIAHYQAQLALRPKLSIWLFELGSFFALVPFICIAVCRHTLSRSVQPQEAHGVRLVFAKRWRSNPEIFSIPSEIDKEDVKTRDLAGQVLSGNDASLVLKLLLQSLTHGAPFPFQLALKCAVDLAKVRAVLDGQRPKFILVYWEFSCSLSFITHAMAASGVETFNVMHGDKFYYAKHAFFEVTRCYCWNAFYVDLFKEEYARADFRVFENESFVLSEEEKGKRKNCASATIGIAAPHLATLAQDKDQEAQAPAAFALAINALAEHYAVKIRPHPFYESEFQKFEPHLSSNVQVETYESVTPRSFLLENEIIVGTVSTLLLEAAHLGFPVIMLETDAMKSVETYHYLYKMKNVRTAPLASLLDVAADIDAERALRQTKS